jgi:hypothetical protein
VGFGAPPKVEDEDGSEMDDDLRFALELSLAEAKSAEEGV